MVGVRTWFDVWVLVQVQYGRAIAAARHLEQT